MKALRPTGKEASLIAYAWKKGQKDLPPCFMRQQRTSNPWARSYEFVLTVAKPGQAEQEHQLASLLVFGDGSIEVTEDNRNKILADISEGKIAKDCILAETHTPEECHARLCRALELFRRSASSSKRFKVLYLDTTDANKSFLTIEDLDGESITFQVLAFRHQGIKRQFMGRLPSRKIARVIGLVIKPVMTDSQVATMILEQCERRLENGTY